MSTIPTTARCSIRDRAALTDGRRGPHAKSARIVGWIAGLTRETNAFFLGTSPRQYVDSAPHSVANSSLTLNAWHGLFSSLRYRHIGRYLLVNPDDTSVRRLRRIPTQPQSHASGSTSWISR